jgi:DNA-binding LacI/PurR family transcriptional regulator
LGNDPPELETPFPAPGAQAARPQLDRAPTLRDVAELARVDPSVVSRVINRDPALKISAETRDRILVAADRLRYQPNMMARGLAMSKTWTLGMLLPSIANPAYAEMASGARSRCETAGYVMVIGTAQDGAAPEMRFAELLSRGRVDGLIVASATVSDEFIGRLAQGPAPVVVINRHVPGLAATVAIDEARASRDAVRYLASLGHREVAHIAGPAGVSTALERLNGFRREVAQTDGMTGYVQHCEAWDAASGYRATLELLRREPRVTALYVVNLLAAVGALRASREVGRAVPEDLSVLAYQDYSLAEFTDPPLSTLAVPYAEAGSVAVDLVLERMSGQPARSVVIATAPDLIVRGSTGPAPHRSATASAS